MLLDQRDRPLFVLVTHNPYGWRCNRRPRCAGASAHHACLDPEIGEQAARKLGVTGETRCEDPSHASSKDSGNGHRLHPKDEDPVSREAISGSNMRAAALSPWALVPARANVRRPVRGR